MSGGEGAGTVLYSEVLCIIGYGRVRIPCGQTDTRD